MAKKASFQALLRAERTGETAERRLIRQAKKSHEEKTKPAKSMI
jgi:hypothetical protein